MVEQSQPVREHSHVMVLFVNPQNDGKPIIVFIPEKGNPNKRPTRTTLGDRVSGRLAAPPAHHCTDASLTSHPPLFQAPPVDCKGMANA
jgi:hypothetical protein